MPEQTEGAMVEQREVGRLPKSDHELVIDFQNKFELHDVANTERILHLKEEFEEMENACCDQDFFDALLDMAYLIHGIAANKGYKWQEGFERVHKANMAKVRIQESKGHKGGMAKPMGWKPPELGDLV